MEKKVERRGRPKKIVETVKFDPSRIDLCRGSDIEFRDDLLIPFKVNNEIDLILSTDGGLMPGTNMVFVGGPGSGKSTLTLDILASLTQQGKKCLYVSGEMDRKGHYKYCKRIPKFSCVQTLFLQNHMDDIKETMEYVFDLGYDVIGIDSIAEVLEIYRETHKCTLRSAESWFLNLQDKMKNGENSKKYYTSFINIQQVTKSGDFTGSNRIKHMTDAMAHIEVSKDNLDRSIHFSKNRDCDKDYKIYFSIYGDGVQYAFNQEEN